MTDSAYVYTKTPVDIDSLEATISASALITKAIDYCSVFGSQLTIYMKEALPDDGTATPSLTCQTAALEAIVTAHSGIPNTAPVTPRDSDNSPIYRPKTTKTGWHFEPRSIDFRTAKSGVFNRKSNGVLPTDGTDYGDAVMTYLDNTGAKIVQGQGQSLADFNTQLANSCVTTYMDWEPTYALDLVGGYFQIKNPPPLDTPAYLWITIAPDVPEFLGGSVPFAAGGWCLSFFNDGDIIDVDGKGVKSFVPDPVYHSAKIRMMIKHPVGWQLGIQIIYKQYKA